LIDGEESHCEAQEKEKKGGKAADTRINQTRMRQKGPELPREVTLKMRPAPDLPSWGRHPASIKKRERDDQPGPGPHHRGKKETTHPNESKKPYQEKTDEAQSHIQRRWWSRKKKKREELFIRTRSLIRVAYSPRGLAGRAFRKPLGRGLQGSEG